MVRVPTVAVSWAGGIAAGSAAALTARAATGDGSTAEHAAAWAIPAGAGLAALGLLAGARGSNGMRLAGGAALGAATGAAAVGITSTDTFDDVRHHPLLRMTIAPAVIWTGLGTVAALGGRRHIGRLHHMARTLAVDPRIGRPTKLAVALWATPVHPVDWAAGSFAVASLARPSMRPVLRDAWHVAGVHQVTRAAAKATAAAA